MVVAIHCKIAIDGKSYETGSLQCYSMKVDEYNLDYDMQIVQYFFVSSRKPTNLLSLYYQSVADPEGGATGARPL